MTILPQKDPALTELLDMLASDDEQHAMEDDLARVVETAFEDAKSHRASIGVDTDLRRADDAVSGRYSAEELELIDESTNVYMPIIANKVHAFHSWVTDILVNAEDNPWVIKPSPVPELPPEVEEFVLDQLMEEVTSLSFDGTLESRVREMKALALNHMKDISNQAASRMSEVVADQMEEGDWRQEFSAFVQDIGQYPAAILKGPHVEYRRGLRWTASGYDEVKETRYVTERVSPHDCFPAPDSTTPQNGTFFLQRDMLTQENLLDVIDMDGVDEAAIRALIADKPKGYTYEGKTGSDTKDYDVDEGYQSEQSSNFHVLKYYGKISNAKHLLDYGVEVEDHQATPECEIWVCAGRVLRALLNPNPLGKRPFYATSFIKKPGSFWGRSIPSILRDVQRVGNASVRAMVRNMAYSSGPIGEYDASRLKYEENIEQVEPYRMYAVDSDPLMQTSQAALRFTNITSNSREMMMVYQEYSKMADDISGVPAYVLGSPQVAGAGRTLGGLSMLMGNAAKGVKRVIANIDRDVIEPVVGSYTLMNLMFHEDKSLRFDTYVVARGSSGLMQKELMQSRAVEALGVLTPYVQAGVAPVEGIRVVLRDVMRGLGYRADEIVPDPNRAQELGNALQTSPQGGQTPGVNAPPTQTNEAVAPSPASRAAPSVELDGRSEPG